MGEGTEERHAQRRLLSVAGAAKVLAPAGGGRATGSGRIDWGRSALFGLLLLHGGRTYGGF
jgi:hypothetical protein